MGDRYTFPAGIWNSEISVTHFSLGAFAEIAIDDVIWGRADFPDIRAISAPLGPCCVEAALFHEATHDFLR
jgi:hypothetical protein